jgi:hypothetical protein
MYCKPGKVRAMVEKFVAMNRIGVDAGMPAMRIMTDLSAERYWTVVAEMEVSTLDAWEKMMTSAPGSEQAMKEFEKIMKDYHELVDSGRREVYKIEA